jgi:glycosyltransferase involved in cell wall biosynthesis
MACPPRFSIVIPTYNYARFVDRAIDSALAQPGDDFEVLVADDGSTDDTPAVLRRYGGRIRSCRHENRGAAATRNRAAELASGEWLIFLDADDRLLPGAMSHFRAAIAANPAARMVFGHHVSVASDGHRRDAKPQPALRGGIKDFRDYLARRFGIAHGTVALRRDNFAELRYPEGITNGEDIVLFAQTLVRFPCATFPHATAEIHAHSGRMRDNIAAVLETGLKTVDALFQPDVLPPEAMRYRRLFVARRNLSLARSLVKAGRSGDARVCYRQAVRADWKRALTPTNLGRYLRCLFSAPTQGDRRSSAAVKPVPDSRHCSLGRES